MDLITTPGAPDANSLVTLAEADEYLSSERVMYSARDWGMLVEDAKKQRLVFGALLLNSMSFRGAKACREQSLSFPRWRVADEGYPASDNTYITMQDIEDAGYPQPIVPEEAKTAQIELAYQVAHKMIANSEPGDDVDRIINRLVVGNALSVEFGSASSAGYAMLSTARTSALSVVELLLGRWLRRFTGGVV